MLWRHLAGTLVLAQCLGCATPAPSSDVSPWPQVVRPLGEPLIRITFLARDSLGVELADSGYVVILEHVPGSHPRFLFPSYDAEWESIPKGRATLNVPVRLSSSENDVTRLESLCIIQAEVVSYWTPSEGEKRLPATPSCGPVPVDTHSFRKGRVVRPTYEFGSALQGYVLALYMHHTVAPRTLSYLQPSADTPPVQVARGLGSTLVWPLDGRRYWEAALWVSR